MKENNIIIKKSFGFALSIIKFTEYLKSEKKQYVIADQLLRSGTSIGANVKESINAISRADFRHKMSIALKEADETEYWLSLILYSNILNEDKLQIMINECKEICRVLNSIVKNSR
ncbi:four helix bundle protein [Clostridium sp. BJN0001]|uniref:four helix bundle protein n=1 Tax=Clostridium sp. BJN0001 TaxID=2930219 RepID=UPI001FD2EF77|nr:four helix bundle protein [Clostridium sp. BJN0001]